MAEDEKEFLIRLNKRADFFQLKEIIRLLDNACYHIERNANSKILFHALSIQLQYIFAKQPLPLA
jgi:DNA polymerase-3 subunit delta'